jgi:hypothetical protein
MKQEFHWRTLVRLKFLLLFLSLVFLTSCGPGVDATPTATIPTSSPAPTISPTPAIQPLAILVLPADMPKADYDRYQTMVYDLAQAAGLRFQVRNSLTSQDLAFEGSALKVVLALPPDPGLAALAAAAPGVQFLAINIPNVSAGQNLSTLGATGVPVDQQAFLAGYIAGMVAPEWKVGVLYQKDTAEGEAVRDAFTNGFVFYCGACRNPVFSQPAGIYPVTVPMPSDAPSSDYPGYVLLLRQNIVRAAYVDPAIATPDLLNYMTQYDMLVIGENLPGEAARSHWVASIQPDMTAAIQKIFPELLAGQGGQSISTPLFLNDINPELLSEGKKRLVQEVLQGLQDGTISTGVKP